MKGELTYVLMVAQRCDEVQHILLGDESERMNSPAFGLSGFSAAVVGLELPALEQRLIDGIQHARWHGRCLEHRTPADHSHPPSPLLEARALQHFFRLLEVRRELVSDRFR